MPPSPAYRHLQPLFLSGDESQVGYILHQQRSLSVSGCYRCHDGQHKSVDGKVIPSGCGDCHTILQQGKAGSLEFAKAGRAGFQHPVDVAARGRKRRAVRAIREGTVTPTIASSASETCCCPMTAPVFMRPEAAERRARRIHGSPHRWRHHWHGFAGRGLRVRATADRRRRGRGTAARTTIRMDFSGPDPPKIETRNTHSPEFPDCSTTCACWGRRLAKWFWWGSNPPRWDGERSCRPRWRRLGRGIRGGGAATGPVDIGRRRRAPERRRDIGNRAA